MVSTTSVLDQSQIGCHFFFDSVLGSYLRSAIMRMTIFGKHVRQGRSQALGRVCLHEALGAFDGIHVGYLAPIKQTDYQRILDWFPFVEAVACWLGRIVMTWREIVGWGLVALGDAAGVLAAAVKGGTFEALTAASAAFTGAAAMWGYTNKSKA